MEDEPEPGPTRQSATSDAAARDPKVEIGWERLRAEALAKLAANESKYFPFLDELRVASELCRRIVGEGRSTVIGERPQDHLAVSLAIHGFRSTFSGVFLSASGYPDIAPSLARTLFESTLRLIDVERSPIASSLGAALYYTNGVLGIAAVEEGPGVDERRRSWGDFRESIIARAAADGITVSELRRHGKLRFSELAEYADSKDEYRNLGFLRSYRIRYAESTAFAHARHGSTFYSALRGAGALPGRGGLLLPTDAFAFSAIMSAMQNLGLLLLMAARILDDDTLTYDAAVFLRRLDDRRERHSKEHGFTLE